MILSNSKQEKFCNVYIRYSDDSKWKDILRDSGYSTGRGRKQFMTLLSTPAISGRILELQHQAAQKDVMTLRERLKMLSDFAKDEKETKRLRIAALAQIHKQSGDDVTKLDIDMDGQSVIRFVDVKIPESQKESKKDNKEKLLSISENLTIDDLLGSEHQTILNETVNETIKHVAKNIKETDETDEGLDDFDFEEEDDLLDLDD